MAERVRITRGAKSGRPALITGGAGFIGTNLAERLLRAGEPVILLDNLSRKGVERNLKYLCATYGRLVRVDVADVRSKYAVERAVSRCDRVYHFAAQVAATTSLSDPMSDFETNLQGTVNLLEAVRQQGAPPPLLFASTKEVYGDLSELEFTLLEDRHVPRDPDTRTYGVHEGRGLDFHSPHGCSKGAADQYVLDYARTYGLPNVVLRMSCIYGRHQRGTEDQGWVAHFAMQMHRGGALNIYGDGRQVRDLLYIDDLVDAMLLAMEHIDALAGKAFNIGGGPDNAVRLLDVIDYLSRLGGMEPQIRYGPPRRGDPLYYVSDIRRFTEMTGWMPQIPVEQGISQLYQWLEEDTRPGTGVLQPQCRSGDTGHAAAS